MDSFDRRILSVLRDGKPRDFGQLLKELVFPTTL
jgi:DNA-binding Lrp family transcriptional regulator